MAREPRQCLVAQDLSRPRSHAHLHTLLASLDGGDVAGDTTTNDYKVFLLCRDTKESVSFGCLLDIEVHQNPIPAAEAYFLLQWTILGSLQDEVAR